ncbi:hypothetical protein Tco_0200722 [Tanacetum coccineum]
MNNSITIAYSFELHFTTTSLDGLKHGNINEHQASSSNSSRAPPNFDSICCDDCVTKGSLDQRYPSVRYSSHISCSSVDSLIVGNEEIGDMGWCVCCYDEESPIENEEMRGMVVFSGVGGLLWVVFLSIVVGF